VSYAQLVANDYEGRTYIGELDTFTTLKVSVQYGSDGWTQIFEGKTEKVGPLLNNEAQTVQAVAYGYGAALRSMHCDAQYGSQISSSLDVPEEIWDDLVDNHINKSFGGAASGHAITKTKIKSITTPTIPFLEGGYRSCLDLVNAVSGLHTASQAGSAGVHWFVDTDQNLWIDTIGAHTVDTTNWPTWWNTNQDGSTLVEGTDFVGVNFSKRIRDFANKIVLISGFRKPGYDYWTEYQGVVGKGGSALWGNDGITNINDENVDFVVGAYSLEFDMDSPPGTGRAYYPSTEDAAWDLTKCGSSETIPTINFYFKKDANCNEPSCSCRLFTTDHDTDYFYWVFSTWGSDPNGEWIHRSMPIGPYWKTAQEDRRHRWVAGTGAIAAPGGAADWADINGVAFRVTADPATDTEFLIDDLHISGKIVREAYNSTSIAANTEYQKILRMDIAIDESLTASDDTGTAGLLAYNELLTRQTTPVVGQVTTPGIVDVLPGQKIHVHADQQASDTFRVDSTFRIKEIVHSFTQTGFTTTLDVTDDLTNTFAFGYMNMVRTLAKAFYIDPEAQNLKASGVDTLVSRLSKDYPS
jgi:hypothetical protein